MVRLTAPEGRDETPLQSIVYPVIRHMKTNYGQ
jgi:hypothetical protein